MTLAKSIYEDLVNRNPENHAYYEKLVEASEAKSIDEKLAIFETYREKFPRAAAPKRLPLNIATGQYFWQPSLKFWAIPLFHFSN